MHAVNLVECDLPLQPVADRLRYLGFGASLRSSVHSFGRYSRRPTGAGTSSRAKVERDETLTVCLLAERTAVLVGDAHRPGSLLRQPRIVYDKVRVVATKHLVDARAKHILDRRRIPTLTSRRSDEPALHPLAQLVR